MKKWWIGCSGFYYKSWQKVFYPKKLPQNKWFEFYCGQFNSIEINATFYRFPRMKDLERWYTRSPDDFLFAVKAPRLITHFKRFNNVTRELQEFYHTLDNGLKDKLGPILFQLHPGIEFSDAILERILNTLDKSFANAIEFRHPTWWRPDVIRALRKNNVTFCGINHPSLPDQVVRTAPSIYYRFHGVPNLYLSSYRKKKLSLVVDEIKRKKSVRDIFIYFNNDIKVAAVRNAKTVQNLI